MKLSKVSARYTELNEFARSDPDPGDSVTAYQWTQTAGDIVNFDKNSPKPTFQVPTSANADMVFSLTVTDNHGQTSENEAVVTIHINHPPDPVIEIFPSNTVGMLKTVTFDASKSSDPDPGDKIISYTWQQVKTNPNDPDVPIVFRSANSDIIKFVAPSVNKETKVTFSLGIADSHGAISTTTASVLVKPGNRPPIAVAQATENGIYILLDGSKSFDEDPGDKVVAYQWTQIDNTGIKADIRGAANDPNQYFVQPKVDQPTTLSFSLAVTDTHGAQSQNSAIVDVVIKPCNAVEIKKVTQVEQELKRDISVLRFFGYNVGADTLDLWMTGTGAKLYPLTHPRPLSISWLRSSIEVHFAQNALHELFEGPHNKGTRTINSLSAFIDGLPNDGNGYEFTDNWDKKVSVALPGFVPVLTDYNIAVGGSQIHADGRFIAAKGEFRQNGVTVTGGVTYSLLDRFDWNKGTFFGAADNFNLLEKCGDAAPFWSAATWKQSVQGLGQDLPSSLPNMQYFWRDRNN
jgi:hypothetical protein